MQEDRGTASPTQIEGAPRARTEIRGAFGRRKPYASQPAIVFRRLFCDNNNYGAAEELFVLSQSLFGVQKALRPVWGEGSRAACRRGFSSRGSAVFESRPLSAFFRR